MHTHTILFVGQNELTELLAELTEFAAEFSEFSLLKQYSRNSIPPVSHLMLSRVQAPKGGSFDQGVILKLASRGSHGYAGICIPWFFSFSVFW